MLVGRSWFSTLDHKSGYWQVKIYPNDRKKTAFSVVNGLWQFIVIDFELCNALGTFKQFV